MIEDHINHRQPVQLCKHISAATGLPSHTGRVECHVGAHHRPGPLRRPSIKRRHTRSVLLATGAGMHDGVVHHDQHPPARCQRRRRHSNRLQKVGRAIGTQVIRRTHRPRKYNGFFRLDDQVQEKSGFFQGIRPVGDHQAVDVFPAKPRLYLPGNGQQFLVANIMTRQGHQVDAMQIGDLARLRYARQQISGRARDGIVLRPCLRVRQRRGDGSPCGQHDDSRTRHRPNDGRLHLQLPMKVVPAVTAHRATRSFMPRRGPCRNSPHESPPRSD